MQRTLAREANKTLAPLDASPLAHAALWPASLPHVLLLVPCQKTAKQQVANWCEELPSSHRGYECTSSHTGLLPLLGTTSPEQPWDTLVALSPIAQELCLTRGSGPGLCPSDVAAAWWLFWSGSWLTEQTDILAWSASSLWVCLEIWTHGWAQLLSRTCSALLVQVAWDSPPCGEATMRVQKTVLPNMQSKQDFVDAFMYICNVFHN